MNTRWLFVISLVVGVFAIWFYRNQEEAAPPINVSETNVEYQASDIVATQTDEQGLAEYSLVSDELIHFDAENMDRLNNMTLNWRSKAGQNVVVNADSADMYHEHNKVVMSNNVMLVSRPPEAGEQVNPPLTLQADQLIGDLAQSRIYSEGPVTVSQGDNRFTAQKVTADLLSGDYEFDQVEVTFLPPEG